VLYLLYLFIFHIIDWLDVVDINIVQDKIGHICAEFEHRHSL